MVGGWQCEGNTRFHRVAAAGVRGEEGYEEVYDK